MCFEKLVSAFWEEYDNLYAPKLAHRSATFRQIFSTLLSVKEKDFVIVETGCSRIPGNFAGDGQSTLLFARFLDYFCGQLYVVDIDPVACAQAQSVCGEHVGVYCGDSVLMLARLASQSDLRAQGIDLVYLDSYDVDFIEPHNSSLHHLFELTSIMPLLRENSVVFVDDTPKCTAGFTNEEGRFEIASDLGLTGKGKYVAAYLERLGFTRLFSAYQAAWMCKPGELGPLIPYENADYSPDVIGRESSEETSQTMVQNYLSTQKILRELEEEHAAVIHSRSWRLTAPLRAIASFLRR